MESHFVMVGALCLAGLLTSASYAGVTINGTTITFDDDTMQSTANPPSDHGGTGNTVSGTDSFLGGGYLNRVTGDFGTVGGGRLNLAGDDALVDPINTPYATVGGGRSNAASASYATVGGGWTNSATSYSATVGGGLFNRASGSRATVAGGSDGWASGDFATVGGGFINTASGAQATVPGGFSNVAAGDFSFAAGRRAKIDALHDGAFLFADQTNADFDSVAANEFAVRATGGVRFITNSAGTAGQVLAAGGSTWSSPSSKSVKENMHPLDTITVLEKLVSIPVEEWNYIHEEDGIKHYGPYAEDFHEAFGLNGPFDGRIASLDVDGVALAAIQGLYAMQHEELQEQAEVNTALRWHNAQLEARLARLENAILREREREQTGTD